MCRPRQRASPPDLVSRLIRQVWVTEGHYSNPDPHGSFVVAIRCCTLIPKAILICVPYKHYVVVGGSMVTVNDGLKLPWPSSPLTLTCNTISTVYIHTHENTLRNALGHEKALPFSQTEKHLFSVLHLVPLLLCPLLQMDSFAEYCHD